MNQDTAVITPRVDAADPRPATASPVPPGSLVRIRSYTPDDLDSLADLMNANAFGVARHGIAHSGASVAQAIEEQGVADIVVAVDEAGAVQGCLWLMPVAFHRSSRPGGIFAENYLISAPWRMTTVALQLARQAGAIAIERGFHRLDLGLYVTGLERLRLYERLGFRLVDDPPDENGVVLLEAYPQAMHDAAELIGARAELDVASERSPASVFRAPKRGRTPAGTGTPGPSAALDTAALDTADRDEDDVRHAQLEFELDLAQRRWRVIVDRRSGTCIQVDATVPAPEATPAPETPHAPGAVAASPWIAGRDRTGTIDHRSSGTTMTTAQTSGRRGELIVGQITEPGLQLVESWPDLGPPFVLAPVRPAPLVIRSHVDDKGRLCRSTLRSLGSASLRIDHRTTVTDDGGVEVDVSVTNHGTVASSPGIVQVAVRAQGGPAEIIYGDEAAHRGRHRLEATPHLLMEAEHHAAELVPTSVSSYPAPVTTLVGTDGVLVHEWDGASEVRFGSAWAPIVRYALPALEPGAEHALPTRRYSARPGVST